MRTYHCLFIFNGTPETYRFQLEDWKLPPRIIVAYAALVLLDVDYSLSVKDRFGFCTAEVVSVGKLVDIVNARIKPQINFFSNRS